MSGSHLEQHLTVPAIAEALSVDRGIVYQAIEEGSLPARRLGKRTIRVAQSDLDAWLDSRRVHPDYVAPVDSPRGADTAEASFRQVARSVARRPRPAPVTDVRPEGRR